MNQRERENYWKKRKTKLNYKKKNKKGRNNNNKRMNRIYYESIQMYFQNFIIIM